MNKQDWIWVSIRIFGIFLIVLAITNLPELFVSCFKMLPFSTNYSFTVTQSGMDAASCEEFANQMRINSVSVLIESFLKVIIFGSFGLYFIHGGRFLFNLISSTESLNKE